MRLGLILLTLLASCRTPWPADAALKTDETKSSMLQRCRDVFADGDYEARIAGVCGCLSDKRADPRLGAEIAAFCDEGRGRAHFKRFLGVLREEGQIVVKDDAGRAPTADDNQCLEDLAGATVEGAIDRIARACKEDRRNDLANLLASPPPAAAGACWRFRRMDDKGCVVAVPCAGQDADLAQLPVPGLAGKARAGDEVTICHPVIQSMQALKDPDKVSLDYNYPFASLLTNNRSAANVTYGAANCHGTAQEFAGGFLARLPVASLTYHSPWVEDECGALARSAYDGAKKSAGNGAVTGDRLPIGKGGYVVNMNHDASCPATDCGKASFETFKCAGGALQAHVFFNGMCINCWDQMLRDAGYTKLAADATWKDLKRGCILTQSDHSVTFVYQNDGFCYSYESLAPFAPPQLNVHACPQFFGRFPQRWCPAKELGFQAGVKGT